MRTYDNWLAEYSQSHRNRTNQRFHKVCVPLILWSVVGATSLLRAGNSIATSAAPVFCAFALAFYALLGIKPFLQMVVLFAACIGASFLLEMLTDRAWIVYLAVFVIAWIGQAIGHVFEGKKPSFFKDVQFLLIGPLWILRKH